MLTCSRRCTVSYTHLLAHETSQEPLYSSAASDVYKRQCVLNCKKIREI
ncbi:hypothetical protein ACX3V1_25965 [Escherichia coli]